jgi:peptidoglycan lytic transglycosylase
VVPRIVLAVLFALTNGGIAHATPPSALTSTRASAADALFHAAPSAEDRRLIEAKAALTAGEAERARALLQERAGPLDDYRSLLLGQALLALGQPQKAYAALSEVRAPKARCPSPAPEKDEHPLFTDAQLLRAKILAEQEPIAAAELLAALPRQAGVLAEAADLYRRAGEIAQAEAIEARLLVETPDQPEARALQKQLRDKGVAKRLGTVERRLERVRKLLETQQNIDAKMEGTKLLDEIGKSSGDRCELLYVVGKADRKLRQYQAAEHALKDAREQCTEDKSTDLAMRSALLEVQVRAIRGEVKETERIVNIIAKADPPHSFADDALMFLANLLEDSGRPADAKKIYLDVVDRFPDGDQSAEASWRLAYLAIKDGDGKSAEKPLASILAAKGVPLVERARARYWLARMLEGPDAAKARALYEETALEPSFYAWLTLQHLQEAKPDWAAAIRAKLVAIRDAESSVHPMPLPASIVGAAELERARRLFILGAGTYAEAELSRLACGDISDEEALALALAFDAMGAHPHAQELLRARADRMLKGPLTADNLHVWRAAYSRPFLDHVEKAASAEKLEPLFLLALVREESTFDPQIVSWAGAIGLSQLMPGTAMAAHAALGLGRLEVARLTDPALNLRLGAHVLRDGMRTFKNKEPLALVAYNGGNGVAQRLIDREKPKPFERWVEDIGIRETRRYVKRVTETWGIYRFLYDRAQPFIQLPAAIGGP